MIRQRKPMTYDKWVRSVKLTGLDRLNGQIVWDACKEETLKIIRLYKREDDWTAVDDIEKEIERL